MTDTKQDAARDTSRLPHAAPTVTRDEPKPEKTPAQKAAATRKRNERAAAKADSSAAEAAEATPAAGADSRTWSCPQCGRGVTLGPDQQPPTIMRCEGCGRDSMGDTWLPPSMGHGEPTLQVAPIH